MVYFLPLRRFNAILRVITNYKNVADFKNAKSCTCERRVVCYGK